jgi:hypothetical protein
MISADSTDTAAQRQTDVGSKRGDKDSNDEHPRIYHNSHSMNSAEFSRGTGRLWAAAVGYCLGMPVNRRVDIFWMPNEGG